MTARPTLTPMGAVRRVLAATAALGIAVTSLVLLASFLPGEPRPSPPAGWVLFGLAAFFFVIGLLGFLAPYFAGKMPFDPQAPRDSKMIAWGIAWDRASPVERLGVQVATFLAFLLWIPAGTADSGTVLQQRLLALIGALLFTAALGLVVVGARPVEVDEFDKPKLL